MITTGYQRKINKMLAALNINQTKKHNRESEPAELFFSTVDIGSSNLANVLNRDPEGLLTDKPANGWPLVIYFGGDGSDNNATTEVTAQAMSSGDTFTWEAVGANTGSNRILGNSIVVKDDGVEIATGTFGGVITGPNITAGSVDIDIASRAQVHTITLTGTSGTADVTVAGGLTKTATFNTSLTQTATDFDTTHSAAYLAVGITITSSGANIIFTATVPGVPFSAPVINNVTGNLAGSVVATTTNVTCLITITSSVALSGAITVDYIYSTLLVEGTPMIINEGDTLDERCLFRAIQNRGNDADLTLPYFDTLIRDTFLAYDINVNRISLLGLSRGGRAIMRVGNPGFLDSRFQFWINETTGVVSATDLGAGYVESGIASVVCATTDIGGSYTVANYDGVGVAVVQGTADTTLTNNTPLLAATWGADATLKEYPYILDLFGINHTSTVWHTNCFYRLYRTDTAGTAPWDYVDFILKYSRDLNACGTLFVEQAEKRRYGTEKDIIDYREAVRKVDQLTAGATKTALEARLVTLKTELDSEIVARWIISHNVSTITPTGNVNNISNHADNQRVDDIIDDNGNVSTGMDWVVGDNPLGSGYQAEFSSGRGYGNVGGFQTAINRSGQTIGSSVCPLSFVGAAAGTYTLRIWHMESNGSLATNREFTATINSQTKSGYSQYNKLIGYTEWTGLDETDIANYSLGRNNADIYITCTELVRTA